MDQLLAMGMDGEASRRALQVADGNVERALDLLLSGALEQERNSMGSPALHLSPGRPLDGGSVHQCNISQYTFGGNGGESACTIISVLAAHEFLQALHETVRGISNMTTRFESVIARGAALSSPAHLSAEEVLQSPMFMPECKAHLQVCGLVLQGLITLPNAFASLINAARESSDTGAYAALVITKPPESVCLLIPPTAAGAQTDLNYYLLDSHSRPQLGLEMAYIVMSTKENIICERLASMFLPFLDDLDEMQALMYNSMDGTVLQYK